MVVRWVGGLVGWWAGGLEGRLEPEIQLARQRQIALGKLTSQMASASGVCGL